MGGGEVNVRLVLVEWEDSHANGDGGGLLCPSCMCKRALAAGLSDIPARFTSGPFCVEPKFWRDSYELLRDAIVNNFGEFVHDGDIAEEAIVCQAVEQARQTLDGIRALNGSASPAPTEGAGTVTDEDALRVARWTIAWEDEWDVSPPGAMLTAVEAARRILDRGTTPTGSADNHLNGNDQ